MEKSQKLTWRRFFESPLFFIAGLVILILVSISLTRAQFKDREIRSEIARLEEQVSKLEGERTQYEDILALLNTPQFLEDEARRSLGYVLPGEKVVVIDKNEECLPPARAGGAQAGRSEDGECDEDDIEVQEMSNPRKWWIYFFGS